MQVGIDSINQLLENFMGINDTELGECSKTTRPKANNRYLGPDTGRSVGAMWRSAW